MDTKIRGKVETCRMAIAADTVIEAGDLVALSSGLIIKATATSEKVARAMEAHAASGGSWIEVSRGNIEILIDASNAFAVTQRGGEYDIAVSGAGKQTVNTSGNTYKVLMIDPREVADQVGETTDIKCIINKPLIKRA